MYTKPASEMSTLMWNCVRDRIHFSQCSKFVNLTAKRKQLFVIAVKAINMDSDILLYPTPVLILALWSA